MVIETRIIHKISNPSDAWERHDYAGEWTIDALWAWARANRLNPGRKAGHIPARINDKDAVVFLNGNYHAVLFHKVED